MRNILYILTMVLCLAGCKKPAQPTPDAAPEKTLSHRIPGEWHCVVSEIDADIYLSIMDNAAFELYQKVGEGSHRLYRGTWTLDEATCEFNGKYNDKSMTLTPKNSSDEKHSYSRKDIPSEVKDNCVVVVKSGSDEAPVL